MKRSSSSPILSAGVVVVSGPLLMFSAYLLFTGHNQPGGGFSGGLVAGITVLLVWAAGGLDSVRRVLPVKSNILMGAGLSLAALTGFAAFVPGLEFLESGYIKLHWPLVGEFKIVSALFFDIGVYLVVVGMAVGLIKALGDEGSAESPEESS